MSTSLDARPSLEGSSLPRLGSSVAAITAAVATAIGAVSVGLLVVVAPVAAYGLAAFTLGSLYIGLCALSPRTGVIVFFLVLALVPVYVVPDIFAFSPQPAALAAGALALAFSGRAPSRRFTGIDIAFSLFIGAMAAASLLGPTPPFAAMAEMFLYVAPYLAGRAICARAGGDVTFAFGAALVGVVAVPFVVHEAMTHYNVFFQLASSGSRFSALWASSGFRGTDVLRTEAAFGHPLSMAFIMASAAIFAIALAVRAESSAKRAVWLTAAAVIMLVHSTSEERSGWLLFAVGIFLFVASALPRTGRARHLFVITILAAPLVTVGLSLSSSDDLAAKEARADSAEHRIKLYERAFEPGALKLLGSRQDADFNAFVAPVAPGTTAIDSAYLGTADIYGLISLLAMFGVVATLVRAAFELRGRWAAVMPAVAIADFTALLFIGFQTQVPMFSWLVVGAVSGVMLSSRGTTAATTDSASPPTVRDAVSLPARER